MTLSDLTSKTPEELNVMCAELCGETPDDGSYYSDTLPNYTGSWDAIMPEVRKLSPDQFIDYLVHLSDAADASHIGQFQAHYHPELVTIALILTLTNQH